MTRICIVPQVSGVGGMVSFRAKFTAGLASRKIEVTDDIQCTDVNSVLVIGGTRDLLGLWQAKRRGVRIVQRLNGMNWLHRLQQTGIKHYLRAEYGNLILRLIRHKLADHIVYQSEFAKGWWERIYGTIPVSSSVAYNAVDLSLYKPDPRDVLPLDHYKILLVEGSLMGGYELGLESAVQLVEHLNSEYHAPLGKPTKLTVAGRVTDLVKSRWSQKTEIDIHWVGLELPEEIPALDRSAHMLYSSDINAACPNSVVEALACGLPVLAFDTGALPELVTEDAGRVVAYGGDPWKLEKPDVPSLAEAAMEILTDQPRFRFSARVRAEKAFDLDQMVDQYLDALIV